MTLHFAMRVNVTKMQTKKKEKKIQTDFITYVLWQTRFQTNKH